MNIQEILEKRGISAKGVLRSFDLLGEIAIVEIPETLAEYEKDIAEAIMAVHKHVKAVYKKVSAVSGEYRIKRIQLIAGEKVNEVHYRESGVDMIFDPNEVFFSPRLSFERLRIANEVKNKERVLVLFAGVGPFALVIAKRNPTAYIGGIELNPKAVEYFRKNVALNRLHNIIIAEGDVRDKVNEFRYWADRIVMPLPKDGEHFLKYAAISAKHNAIIHFYTFVSRDKPLEHGLEKIKANLHYPFKVLKWRKVRSYSPDTIQIAIDFQIFKEQEEVLRKQIIEGIRKKQQVERKGMIVGVLGGTFDVLHEGHMFAIREARRRCDILVVVVARDEAIRRKGFEPFHTQTERLDLINMLTDVDLVTKGGKDMEKTAKLIEPDIIFLGYDQPELKWMKKYKVIRLPRYPRPLSTRLLR